MSLEVKCWNPDFVTLEHDPKTLYSEYKNGEPDKSRIKIKQDNFTTSTYSSTSTQPLPLSPIGLFYYSLRLDPFRLLKRQILTLLCAIK